VVSDAVAGQDARVNGMDVPTFDPGSDLSMTDPGMDPGGPGPAADEGLPDLPPEAQECGCALPELPTVDVASEVHPDTEAIRAKLEAAVIDLTYPSESDFPFVVVVVPGAWHSPVTKDNVKDVIAPVYVPRPDDMPLAERTVETTTIDDVMGRLITPEDWWTDYEKDLQPKYQALYDILTKDVHGVEAFRIGPYNEWMGLSPDIDIFLIGGSDEGDLIGVWTVSIET
jgi:hypothetical protein